MGSRSDTKRRKGSFYAFGAVQTTRYPELAYQRQGSHFRILDVGTGLPVGQPYRTASALADDLSRFAADFGCK